ncbi:MAG: tRNA (guanosine(18)-2'-O)-methyltransferase TrmH [Gemmatimonadota bacterium]|nr:tRNA (guanosine(18)-2'-O)-methyltransferase TrmH [Gemmatimonadota bacterium]MDE3006809.1 tRNA (guanosine(18)-2'-O)-methyltransferase TrmH [Gemmatimonadota bacterium]MDE3013430.1 tRNA (guanosine(18)-2'-O)-methyltransferase TrmH [Gemmatimonadota bacterium]
MTPERFARLRQALSRRQPDLTVLMDQVNKSHNFSAILRNCDAAGVLGVHVVPPERGLDLHHGTSAGSKKWVQVHRHPDIASAVHALKRQGLTVLAAHPSTSSVDFREIDYTKPTAIMMGAELHGVSDEGLALADQHLLIPMLGMVHSLNVSVATALILFEAARQRSDAGLYNTCRLEAEDFERRLFEWAYPSIASARRQEGRPYPGLTEGGEIIRDW